MALVGCGDAATETTSGEEALTVQGATFDSTFGSAGKVDLGTAGAVAVASDGSLALARIEGDSVVVDQRDADGRPKASFGTGGSVRASLRSLGTNSFHLTTTPGPYKGVLCGVRWNPQGMIAVSGYAIEHRPEGATTPRYTTAFTYVLDAAGRHSSALLNGFWGTGWNSQSPQCLAQAVLGNGQLLVRTSVEPVNRYGYESLLTLDPLQSNDEVFRQAAPKYMQWAEGKSLELAGLGILDYVDGPRPRLRLSTGRFPWAWSVLGEARLSVRGAFAGQDGHVHVVMVGPSTSSVDTFDRATGAFRSRVSLANGIRAGEYLARVTEDKSGRLWVLSAKARRAASDLSELTLARLLPNGSLDTSFGTAGRVQLHGETPTETVSVMQTQGDAVILQVRANGGTSLVRLR